MDWKRLLRAFLATLKGFAIAGVIIMFLGALFLISSQFHWVFFAFLGVVLFISVCIINYRYGN